MILFSRCLFHDIRDLLKSRNRSCQTFLEKLFKTTNQQIFFLKGLIKIVKYLLNYLLHLFYLTFLIHPVWSEMQKLMKLISCPEFSYLLVICIGCTFIFYNRDPPLSLCNIRDLPGTQVSGEILRTILITICNTDLIIRGLHFRKQNIFCSSLLCSLGYLSISTNINIHV